MDFEKSIGLESVINARELGGYVGENGKMVKSGVLLRTAHLHKLSDNDKQKLEKEYNVKYVIDFRVDEETTDVPDRLPAGARYEHINVLAIPDGTMRKVGEMPTDPMELYRLAKKFGLLDEDLYVKIIESDKGINGYKKFFDILLKAENNEAVLFHCTSGKDRTGIAAMLILSVLGVDEKVIVADYVLSNDYYAAQRKKTIAGLLQTGLDRSIIDKILILKDAVDVNFMTTLIAYLKDTYGSVVDFTKKRLGLTDDDIESLKNKYLER